MDGGNITIIVPSAVAGGLLTVAGNFVMRWLQGGGKPLPKACANCPYHEDHEKRLRALEAHRARAEESLGDIRDDLREVKGLLNAVLLRLGGGQTP